MNTENVLNSIGMLKVTNLKRYHKITVGPGDVIQLKKGLRAMGITKSTIKLLPTTILLFLDTGVYRVTKMGDKKIYVLTKNVALKHRQHPKKLFTAIAGTPLKKEIRGRYKTEGFLIAGVFFPFFRFYDERENEGFDDVFLQASVYLFKKSNYHESRHSGAKEKR